MDSELDFYWWFDDVCFSLLWPLLLTEHINSKTPPLSLCQDLLQNRIWPEQCLCPLKREGVFPGRQNLCKGFEHLDLVELTVLLSFLLLYCNIIAVIILYVNDEPESKFLYIETIKLYCCWHLWCSSRFKLFWDHHPDLTYAVSRVLKVGYLSSDQATGYQCCGWFRIQWLSLSATTGPGVAAKKACTWSWSYNEFIQHNTIQCNLIAKCQYNCTRNVLWCQIHSSHIHTNHKTWNYNNSKYQTSGGKGHA